MKQGQCRLIGDANFASESGNKLTMAAVQANSVGKIALGFTQVKSILGQIIELSEIRASTKNEKD